MAIANEETIHAIKDMLNSIVDIIATRQEGFPSGELYTLLMPKMSYSDYIFVIDILVKANKITNSNHLLKVVK